MAWACKSTSVKPPKTIWSMSRTSLRNVERLKGKGYMKTYWLKGKRDLSFKTPAELRYSNQQKDSEDRSSNGSTCTNSKHSPSNLNTPNEEQAEGKPTPTDMPPDALPALEGAPDPNTFTNESQQDKEHVKKTKNNKEEKVENALGNAQENTPPAGGQENAATELHNKKHRFRSQYSRLPANLPMRSTACNLL
ncbi:hypothetical protein R3I94_009925 [Phoxinus phoxinus]